MGSWRRETCDCDKQRRPRADRRSMKPNRNVASNGVLPVEPQPPKLQPLADLPALVIADPSRDVRGWSIRSDTGQSLGVVEDLLADPDQLVAEFLLVSRSEASRAESVVPVRALAPGQSHLVLGSGLQPIKLRYISTTRLTARAALGVALVLVLIGSLRVIAC